MYKVLYNSSGVHLSSSVINLHNFPLKVYQYPAQGFIADKKTYYADFDNLLEAHYLSAMLNAPSVDSAIKSHQSRGKGKAGERDISRTPFEACAIPQFDEGNPDHLELARLSQEAHAIIADTPLKGGVVKSRNIAREAVAAQIEAIDVIARQILG